MNARTLSPTSSLDYALAAAAVKRAGRSRRRVAFLVHSPETFSALEPVVAELQRRAPAFELVFFALPCCQTGAAGPYTGLEATYRFLHAKGLSPIALAGHGSDDLETLIRLAPDFIFRQSPWENDIPPVFNSKLLGFANLCYVPYAIGTLDKPLHQYNQPFHNACDLIFCESEYHHRAYAEHRALGTLGVHQTGFPRFEALLEEIQRADAAWPLQAPDNVPRMIWAPHHTVLPGWLGYSTFLMHKDRLLTEARRGRISILFRPHPALRARLEGEGHMSGAAYDQYLRDFASAPFCGVDEQREYIASFAASDCLLTDGLSFFADYMLTGKPIVRTRRSDSSGMNGFTEWLCEACDTVDTGEELQTVLDSIGERRYEDTHAAQRLERQGVLAGLGQGAAARIADVLAAA